MRKWLLILVAIGTNCVLLFAQGNKQDYNKMRDQLLLYKKMYAYADSINKTDEAGVLMKEGLAIADSCDKLHPASYYGSVGEQMQLSHFNEAAFLFYIANLRYRYYNASNPGYSPSGDGALAASMSYVFGEMVGMYLKTNVTNFIAILKKSVDWCETHDYPFFPRSKSPDKYAQQIAALKKAIADLETNKVKYQATWDAERKKMEFGFDEAIKQMDEKIKH